MQLDFIPQVFYDVVARFIPGAALVASWSLVAIEPTKIPDVLRAESSWLFGFGPLLLFIVASYLVGLLTVELWELTLGRFAKKREKEAEESAKHACLEEHKRVQQSLNLPHLELNLNDLPRELLCTIT